MKSIAAPYVVFHHFLPHVIPSNFSLLLGCSEERFCRFCNAELPDWRDVHVGFPKATPVMTVVHNGVTHQVRVDSGPGGRERFQSMIRKIFNLGEEDAIQLTFGCRVPGAGRVMPKRK